MRAGIRKVVGGVLVVVLSLLLLSCGSGNKPQTGGTPQPGTLSFNQSTYQVTSGADTEVIITLNGSNDSNGINPIVTSSNPSVVAVVGTCGTLIDTPGSNTCELEIQALGNVGDTATLTVSAPGVPNATAQVNIVSNTISGKLAFTPTSELITQGSSTQITLSLDGSSNVDNLIVSLTSSNPAITLDKSQCTLSTGSSKRSCQITIYAAQGGKGSAIITAFVPNSSYKASNVATITIAIIPGNLAFSQTSPSVMVGADVPTTLNLVGSSGITNLQVSIHGDSHADASPTSCTLSSATGKTSCQLHIYGQTPGNAIIIATATSTSGHKYSATLPIMVVAAPVPGTLVFSPASENVTVSGQKIIQLLLKNSSGVQAFAVTLNSANSAIATLGTQPCILSSDQPSCDVTIKGVAAGKTTITASATGYQPATNNVTVVNSIDYGKLEFNPDSMTIPGDGTTAVPATLELVDSSGIIPPQGLIVMLKQTSINGGALTMNPTTCTLYSAPYKTFCKILLTGTTAGTVIITASGNLNGNPYQATLTVQVTPDGLFYFTPYPSPSTQITVKAGVLQTIVLHYTGGAGSTNYNPITLYTTHYNGSLGNPLTYTSTTCPSMGPALSCTISFTAQYIAGDTNPIINVNAPKQGGVYTPTPQVSVTIESNGAYYGNLSLTPDGEGVTVGGTTYLKVRLENSDESIPINVTLTPSSSLDGGAVTLSPTTCTLTTANSGPCIITVTGTHLGQALVTATANNEAPVSVKVNINSASQPHIAWDTDVIGVGPSKGNLSQAVLRLYDAKAGTSVTVPIPGNSAGALLRIGGFYPNQGPNSCILTQAASTCSFGISNTGPAPSGYSNIFTAFPQGDAVDPTVTEATVAQAVTPVARTITVHNHCPFTVYPGIDGGASNSTVTQGCPPGTTALGGKCFWNTPNPSNPHHPGQYLLNHNESLSFTIPDSYGVDSGGDGWSGSVTARLQDGSGNWITGGCGSGISDPSGACQLGQTFAAPTTNFEITMLADGPDSYDVTVINGAIVPMVVTPYAGTEATLNTVEPYFGGAAGSITQQNGYLLPPPGQPYLPAATWSFDTTHTPDADASVYNYVLPTTGSPSACTHSNESTVCSSQGGTCGYAPGSVNPAFNGGATPTYQLVCGKRIGYITAAGIWGLNGKSTNTAPFSFESALYTSSGAYPNSNNNPMYYFYVCPKGADGPMQSGYDPTVTYPFACGCVNWNVSGITTPIGQCEGTGTTGYGPTTQGIGFNTAWLNEVLPRIDWLKKACPTCYTYQFDDKASGFTGYTPNPAPQNPATNLNYRVDLCPGGKTGGHS